MLGLVLGTGMPTEEDQFGRIVKVLEASYGKLIFVATLGLKR